MSFTYANFFFVLFISHNYYALMRIQKNLNVSNSGYKLLPCILPANSDYSFYTRLDGIQYFEN